MNDMQEQAGAGVVKRDGARRAGRCGGRCECACSGERDGCGGRGATWNRSGALIALFAGVFVTVYASRLAARGGPHEPGDAPAGGTVVAANEASGAGGGAAAGDAEEQMEPDGSKMVKLTVESTHEAAMPGQGVWIGAVFEIEKGWHTYWQNSGDSGAPPSFEFTVEPEGALTIGAAQWMVPERKVSAGDILDYVYKGRVGHFFPVTLADNLAAGTEIIITCKATWLVCQEACLPGSGQAKLSLRVGRSKESNEAARLRKELERVPMEFDESLSATWSGAALEIRQATREGAMRTGEVPALSFFPYAEKGDLVPVNLLNGGTTRSGVLRLRFDEGEAAAGKRVRGVVRVDRLSGTSAYLLDVPAP